MKSHARLLGRLWKSDWPGPINQSCSGLCPGGFCAPEFSPLRKEPHLTGRRVETHRARSQRAHYRLKRAKSRLERRSEKKKIHADPMYRVITQITVTRNSCVPGDAAEMPSAPWPAGSGLRSRS